MMKQIEFNIRFKEESGWLEHKGYLIDATRAPVRETAESVAARIRQKLRADGT